MSKIVQFSQAEVADPTDFDNISLFARQGDEQIVGGVIGYPHHWAGFTIAKKSSAVLTLSPGTLFQGSIVYQTDLSTDLNVQIYLPLVPNDGKWIAVLARPNDVEITDQRLVETDADTQTTVMQTVPKIDDRQVQYVVQQGTESPTPLKPVIADTDCAICYVHLTTSGIDTIEPGETWRAKTLCEVEGRVTALEVELADALQSISTIQTEIAWISGQLKQIPRPEVMQQLQTDTAMFRRLFNMPTTARAYWYDPGLVTDDWDTANASWLARVKTGVRFQYAQIVDNQLQLATPGDPLMKVVNNLALPAWTETARISVEGNDGYKDISQLVHTVTNAVQNTVSGVSISYGPTVDHCQNEAEWGTVANVGVGDVFNVNGQTYISDGLSTTNTPWNNDPSLDSAAQWNASPASAGHQIYSVQQVNYQSWSQTYWSYYTTTYGVNGSIYGQSFLNSQQCIATSVDLYFTRVDTDGDVHLFICECDVTGAPQFDNVLANSTVTANQLHANAWVKFSFTPTMLDAGKRYAWFTVTVGNHAISTVKDNKYAQGTLFWSTDGAWSQGDPQYDFAFHLNVAQFASTRATVNFTPLSCPGGMSEIQLLYNGWAPPGTSLAWEIQKVGETAWTSILTPTNPRANNPLTGLPPQCALRATFVGTTDLMPAIILDITAREAAMRMRGDFVAVSKSQSFGLSTTSISTVSVIYNYDPHHHSFTGKISIGGTVYPADTTTIAIDPNDNTRYTFTNTFTVPSTTAAVYRPQMTTDTVVLVPFIESALMIAH
jgi:hypothetical protein